MQESGTEKALFRTRAVDRISSCGFVVLLPDQSVCCGALSCHASLDESVPWVRDSLRSGRRIVCADLLFSDSDSRKNSRLALPVSSVPCAIPVYSGTEAADERMDSGKTGLVAGSPVLWNPDPADPDDQAEKKRNSLFPEDAAACDRNPRIDRSDGLSEKTPRLPIHLSGYRTGKLQPGGIQRTCLSV